MGTSALTSRGVWRATVTLAAVTTVLVGCNGASSTSAVSTAEPQGTPADVVAAARDRLNRMWPDINMEARGGGPQNVANELLRRLSPAVPGGWQSISSDVEAHALDRQYGEMIPNNDGTADIVLLSQSPPTNYSTTPLPARLSMPVCYRVQVDGSQPHNLPYQPSNETVAAVLGLRNPSNTEADLANPAMWGMFSVTEIHVVNGCAAD